MTEDEKQALRDRFFASMKGLDDDAGDGALASGPTLPAARRPAEQYDRADAYLPDGVCAWCKLVHPAPSPKGWRCDVARFNAGVDLRQEPPLSKAWRHAERMRRRGR